MLVCIVIHGNKEPVDFYYYPACSINKIANQQYPIKIDTIDWLYGKSIKIDTRI